MKLTFSEILKVIALSATEAESDLLGFVAELDLEKQLDLEALVMFGRDGCDESEKTPRDGYIGTREYVERLYGKASTDKDKASAAAYITGMPLHKYIPDAVNLLLSAL